jgi:Ser/Thr protein kinase RdoA (MazF antagonist)
MSQDTALGERIGFGRMADVYALDDARVVKLFHEWVSPDAIEREARITAAVHGAGAPAPQVYERIEIDGRRGIIFERLDGVLLGTYLETHPWRARWAGRRMADLHHATHQACVHDLPSQRERLRWKIEHADPLPDLLRAAALAALERLPEGDAVCHSDFHPENIIVTRRGMTIIDWIDATRGHPLADVARSALLLEIGESPQPLPRLARWLENAVRRALLNGYLARYLELSGADRADLDAWALPVAAARLSERIPQETARVLARVEALAAGIRS